MMAPSTEPGTDGLPVRPEIWLPSFPELAPILPAAAAAARFDLYGSIRLDRWSTGRVAVLGDAAHAMPSSIGKGANMAMRSAVALAKAVTEGGSPEHGLAAWEAAMRPVVDSAQELAERIVGERALSSGAPAQAYDTPIVHRDLAQSQ
jgi:2-methyl-3-hydroxypyridine 5-carboxylic acid dioxygenase